MAGGKRLLAKRIAARIESIPHTCYAEPFAGMGGVFLRRRLRPKSEILNDINGEIVNLYRVLREHPETLAACFDVSLCARSEFTRLLAVPPGTLTDIQRAARWAFLQRLSFAGKPAHLATPGQMAASPMQPAKITTSGMQRLIQRAHVRLQGVHIECLGWETFIRRYDRPGTLFYLDPPYPGHEADYGRGLFGPEDFLRMAEGLRALKGRFILSISDTATMREMFTWAQIEEVETHYTANIRATRAVREVLISTPAQRK